MNSAVPPTAAGSDCVQLLVDGGVERMAGAQQDGVEVLVLFQRLLVERDLAVFGVGLAQPLDALQPLGTQVGQHVFDTPQAVGPRLDRAARSAWPTATNCSSTYLGISRRSSISRFRLLESGEVHVAAGQGDAGRLLVLAQLVRVDPVDLVEVVVEPARIDGRFAEHFRQVHVVQRQHLADHVEHAAGQRGLHGFQLLQQAFENPALDDGVAVFARGGDEVEGVAVVALADAVDASEPLLQASRVPRHVVVDHQVAELEVDALAGRLGRHAHLGLGAELFLGPLPFVRVHAAVDLARRVAPAAQVLLDVVQRVAVLGEQQQLAAAVLQFRKLRPCQACLAVP